MSTRQMSNQEILSSIRQRAEFYKDKDDYLGIFTVAHVLWLLEEIDRKDRVLAAMAEAKEKDEWSFQSTAGPLEG